MGANQSRPSDAAINEKLIERLQALRIKDEQRSTSEKDGFVVVGSEARRSLEPLVQGNDLMTLKLQSTLQSPGINKTCPPPL
jgi:hypothetical protein